MYCESDQASLCWECDGKVHGANFLVARHMRSLLCRSCQAPTPWRASGSRLAPTLSDDLELRCSPSHSGYFRPSPSSTAAVSRSGWMLDVHEAETNSVRHRKRAALPAGPVPSTNRPRCDRRARGDSATVDFFLPSSRSPPI
ncbi:hypothetical protein Taro_052433 [Colocasia esculenta]|uniref:B box-type domain-containing protein n=1 Tax=Colocasia esculenta TaxID=4460 RepID=A0A843XIL0_COLES|nr:hypothetical protein [Colocasia esculenta]